MRRATPIVVVVALLVLAACGDDSTDDSTDASASTTAGAVTSTTADASTSTRATTPATTAEAAEPLRILVTNDDGIAADGIDVVVQALAELPDVEVFVVAPAENQSGSSDSQLEGAQPAHDATTASGVAGTAVEGEPADSVVYALDEGGLDVMPHLVVSGSNEGQNIGGVVGVSGTVGAARTAARRGIPAIAISQGVLGEGQPPPAYESGIPFLVELIEEHRAEFLAGGYEAPAPVWNLNVPTCPSGEVRGVVEVPVGPPEANIGAPVDCTSGLADPAHDVDAFVHGFAALTPLDAATIGASDPTPVPTT